MDQDFTRFFAVNGKITGFLGFTKTIPGALFLSDLYAKRSADSGIQFPAMLLNVVEDATRMLPDDSVIFIQSENERFCNGIKSVFGEAEKECSIFEFIKVL